MVDMIDRCNHRGKRKGSVQLGIARKHWLHTFLHPQQRHVQHISTTTKTETHQYKQQRIRRKTIRCEKGKRTLRKV